MAALVAPVGPNTPSLPATADQHKLLTKLVTMNPQLVWSSTQEPQQFLSGLEAVLELSPVLHTHWIIFMFMMVPGEHKLERLWVTTNMMKPLLSWNAAKAIFIAHFQRGDYVDGLRWLYNDCHQSQHESIQQYARRFQALATQLGYADNDSQSIYKFIGGLQYELQQQILSHKTAMRTTGGSPVWDFMSLTSAIQLVIQVGTPPIIIKQNGLLQPPLHLRSSALVNPTNINGGICDQSQKRKRENEEVTHEINSSGTNIICYRCQASGHYAYQCPTKRSRKTKVIGVSQVTCLYCNGVGHTTSTCPIKK